MWPRNGRISTGASSTRAGIVSSITAPAPAADLIDRLHATGAVLTYDVGTRTVRAGTDRAVAITADQSS